MSQMVKIRQHFFKIPWLFPDLEKIVFPWHFPDMWQPCSLIFTWPGRRWSMAHLSPPSLPFPLLAWASPNFKFRIHLKPRNLIVTGSSQSLFKVVVDPPFILSSFSQAFILYHQHFPRCFNFRGANAIRVPRVLKTVNALLASDTPRYLSYFTSISSLISLPHLDLELGIHDKWRETFRCPLVWDKQSKPGPI